MTDIQPKAEVKSQDQLDIENCEKEVIAIMEKYGCVFDPFAVMRSGTIDLVINCIKKPIPPAPTAPAEGVQIAS